MSSNSQSEHVFDWNVENFSMMMGKKKIVSREFKACVLQETKWSGILYPHGDDGCPGCGCITVGLQRSKADKGPHAIELKCKVCVIAADGSEVEHHEFVTRPIKEGDNFTVETVKRDFLFSNFWKFLPEDTLTLRFRISNNVVPIFSRTVATSFVDSEAMDIEWTIDDLSCSCVRSFMVSKLFEEPFRIEMLFNPAIRVAEEGTDAEVKTEGANIVVQVVDAKKDFHMWGRISVLDSKDKPQLTIEGDNLFMTEKEDGAKWTFPNFFDLDKLREEKEELLTGDKLRLKCMFLVFDSEQHSELDKETIVSRKIKRSLNDDMLMLHKNGFYPDVKLCTGDGCTQLAHRWVLASRSQVFLEMFEKLALDNILGKCEAKSGSVNGIAPAPKAPDVVDVSGVDIRTLSELLHYLYSDEFPNVEFGDCLRLYSSSVQFRNTSLKTKCLTSLKTKFDSKNVYDALVLADKIGEPHLREAAQDYIAMRKDVILLTDEWQEFVEKEPSLAELVMCDLRVRHQEKKNEAILM